VVSSHASTSWAHPAIPRALGASSKFGNARSMGASSRCSRARPFGRTGGARCSGAFSRFLIQLRHLVLCSSRAFLSLSWRSCSHYAKPGCGVAAAEHRRPKCWRATTQGTRRFCFCFGNRTPSSLISEGLWVVCYYYARTLRVVAHKTETEGARTPATPAESRRESERHCGMHNAQQSPKWGAVVSDQLPVSKRLWPWSPN
jgi:hypothetical protein